MKFRDIKKRAKFFHSSSDKFENMNQFEKKHFAKADRETFRYITKRQLGMTHALDAKKQ